MAKAAATFLLLDTNVLVLLIVGRRNPTLIPRFKRTNRYSYEDYQAAWEIADRYAKSRRLAVTAHVLCQTSDLLGQLPTVEEQQSTRVILRHMVGTILEISVKAEEVAGSDSFLRLGLADAAIEHAARRGYVVLTDDFDLGGQLESQGLKVINLRQLPHHRS